MEGIGCGVKIMIDPIVEEVRRGPATRTLPGFDYDLDAIFSATIKAQEKN